MLLNLKLNFEKLTIFLAFSTDIDCVSKSLCNHMKGVQVMVTTNLQCNSHSQIHSSLFYMLKIV